MCLLRRFGGYICGRNCDLVLVHKGRILNILTNALPLSWDFLFLQFTLLSVKFFVNEMALTGSRSAGMCGIVSSVMQFIVKQISEVFCLMATFVPQVFLITWERKMTL